MDFFFIYLFGDRLPMHRIHGYMDRYFRIGFRIWKKMMDGQKLTRNLSGALIFWRRPSKNYPRSITLQSEANLADGINFRLHPMAIEFLQVENPWSKSGIRLGAPKPPQSSKSVQNSTKINFEVENKNEKQFIMPLSDPLEGGKTNSTNKHMFFHPREP